MSGKAVVVAVGLAGIVAGLVAYWYHTAHPGTHEATVSISRPNVDSAMDRVVSSGPMARPRDYFRVIDRPKYLSVAEAAATMADDEIVLGLDVDGNRRAYPINYLNDHELVREEIAGLPLLVSW